MHCVVFDHMCLATLLVFLMINFKVIRKKNTKKYIKRIIFRFRSSPTFYGVTLNAKVVKVKVKLVKVHTIFKKRLR